MSTRTAIFTRFSRMRGRTIFDPRILTPDQGNRVVDIWRSKVQYTHRERAIAYRLIMRNNKARMKWPDREPGDPTRYLLAEDRRPRGRSRIQRRKPK